VLLLFALWAFEAPFPKDSIPAPIRGVHRFLVNLLTNSWGDMWLYLYQPWEASRIKARFEQEFANLTRPLNAAKIAEYDAVMVIAHSMGSTVAYEGLTGEHLREQIEKFKVQGQQKLFFVSIGSALNLCWRTAPPEEMHRFSQPLSPNFDWLNLWAAYDPVDGDPLKLPDEAYQSRLTMWYPGYVPLVQLEVVNQMDLFSDHSAYWNNAEEVLAPILDALTGRTLTEDLTFNPEARRARVRILSLFKAIAWLVGPVLMVISLWKTGLALDDLEWIGSALEKAGDRVDPWIEDLDWVINTTVKIWGGIVDAAHWLTDWIPFHIVRDILSLLGDIASWAGGLVEDVAGWFVRLILPDSWRDWLRGAWGWPGDHLYPSEAKWGQSLALGIESGLFAYLLYSTIVKWLWDSWDKAKKYNR
jgi:hypothetical protein